MYCIRHSQDKERWKDERVHLFSIIFQLQFAVLISLLHSLYLYGFRSTMHRFIWTPNVYKTQTMGCECVKEINVKLHSSDNRTIQLQRNSFIVWHEWDDSLLSTPLCRIVSFFHDLTRNNKNRWNSLCLSSVKSLRFVLSYFHLIQSSNICIHYTAKFTCTHSTHTHSVTAGSSSYMAKHINEYICVRARHYKSVCEQRKPRRANKTKRGTYIFIRKEIMNYQQYYFWWVNVRRKRMKKTKK